MSEILGSYNSFIAAHPDLSDAQAIKSYAQGLIHFRNNLAEEMGVSVDDLHEGVKSFSVVA